MHPVVGVDDAEDLHLLREVLGGLVQGTGLETRPVLEVHEGEPLAELLAQLLEWPPDLGVGGVVVHHLDHQVGIVDLGERLERGPHHLDRLVVRRHLQRDPRSPGERRRQVRRGAAREDVADLECEGDREQQRQHLEEQEHDGRDDRGHGEAGQEGLEARVHQVGERGDRHCHEELRTEEAPAWLERAHQQHQADGGEHEDAHPRAVVLDGQECEGRGADGDRAERDGHPQARPDRAREQRHQHGGDQQQGEEDDALKDHGSSSVEVRQRAARQGQPEPHPVLFEVVPGVAEVRRRPAR